MPLPFIVKMASSHGITSSRRDYIVLAPWYSPFRLFIFGCQSVFGMLGLQPG